MTGPSGKVLAISASRPNTPPSSRERIAISTEMSLNATSLSAPMAISSPSSASNSYPTMKSVLKTGRKSEMERVSRFRLSPTPPSTVAVGTAARSLPKSRPNVRSTPLVPAPAPSTSRPRKPRLMSPSTVRSASRSSDRTLSPASASAKLKSPVSRSKRKVKSKPISLISASSASKSRPKLGRPRSAATPTTPRSASFPVTPSIVVSKLMVITSPPSPPPPMVSGMKLTVFRACWISSPRSASAAVSTVASAA